MFSHVMKRVLRYMFITITLLGIAVLGAYLILIRSLPDYNAAFTVASLSDEVRVIRDGQGVPHIYAQSAEDAYFALGYVHAQDRLWQMDLERRTIEGRLAEIFGRDALEVDRLYAAFNFRQAAEASLKHLSPETRAVLAAYSRGINSRIAELNAGGFASFPPEFTLLGAKPNPWSETDTVMILKGLNLVLSAGLSNEIQRAKLHLRLGERTINDFFPDMGGTPLIDQAQGSNPLAKYFLARIPRETHLAGASNAWAVSAKRSVTGSSLLANDPHLPLSAPGFWYLAHVEYPGTVLYGGTHPGIPATLAGRNASLAWGLTTVGVDDQDLFFEKLHDNDNYTYLAPGGWLPFEVRSHTFRVKDSEDVTVEYLASRHGPVLPLDVLGLDKITPAGHLPSLSWTALSEDDTSIEAVLDINNATTLDEVAAGKSKHIAPAQNLIVADKSDVAYFLAGRIPIRQIDSRYLGRLPTPGWTGEGDWIDVMPEAEKPQVLRSRTGAVLNANNKVLQQNYPLHITHEWEPPYRANRIKEFLAGRPYHSLDSFKRLQLDEVSGLAKRILPLIGKLSPPEHSRRPDLWQEAYDLITEWDGQMSAHQPEPLIFSAWMRKLSTLMTDEVGEELDLVPARPHFLVEILGSPRKSALCNILDTEAIETCKELAAIALDEALLELAHTYGTSTSDWRWGRAHRAVHRHQPFGQIKTLGGRIDLGVFLNVKVNTSGGDYSVRRAATDMHSEHPYENVHAGGYRAIFDLSNLERSQVMVTAGQSGHFLSRYYANLARPWALGDYMPMLTDVEAIRASAIGEMVLMPANDGDGGEAGS